MHNNPAKRCPRPATRLNPPHTQRGAAMVMTAVFMVAAVAALGLAIEVGRLYTAQSQLNKVAQLAALQSARVIGACADSEPADPQAAAQAAVDAAVADHYNNNTLSSQQVQLGMLDYGQSDDQPLAQFTPSNKFAADSTVVTLTRPSPTPLLSMFAAGNTMTATAGAVSRPVAGISAGSALANVGDASGLNGVLSALLGGPVNLSAASFQGLVDTSISIADLIQAQAGVATPQELLNTSLSLPDALQLLGSAVDQTTGGANDAVATTLDTLAGIADSSRQVLIGDVLNIEPGLESVVSALPINTAQLLTGLAQAANQGSPVSLPVGLDLGGLAKATGEINIISPPGFDFGRAGLDAQGQPRTVARTAQVAIQLDLTVLGALPSALGGALIHIPIFIKAASAKASLDDIICAGPTKQEPPKDQNTVKAGPGTSAATIGVGEFDDISALDPQPAANNKVRLVNALGIAQIETTRNLTVDLGTSGCVAPGANELTFTGPFPPQDGAKVQTQTVGTPVGSALNCTLSTLASDLAQPGTLRVKLLGACIPILCQITSGLLAPALQAVVGLVTPVLGLLDNILLTPLFQFLGLSVGTADVSIQSLQANQPRLFCTGIADCQQRQP